MALLLLPHHSDCNHSAVIMAAGVDECKHGDSGLRLDALTAVHSIDVTLELFAAPAEPSVASRISSKDSEKGDTPPYVWREGGGGREDPLMHFAKARLRGDPADSN